MKIYIFKLGFEDLNFLLILRNFILNFCLKFGVVIFIGRNYVKFFL